MKLNKSQHIIQFMGHNHILNIEQTKLQSNTTQVTGLNHILSKNHMTNMSQIKELIGHVTILFIIPRHRRQTPQWKGGRSRRNVLVWTHNHHHPHSPTPQLLLHFFFFLFCICILQHYHSSWRQLPLGAGLGIWFGGGGTELRKSHGLKT